MNLTKYIFIELLKKKYLNQNYLSWINDTSNQKNIKISKKFSLTDLRKFYENSKKSKNFLYGIFYLKNRKNNEFGFNASTNEYCNMFDSGIIDPLKVVRSAL